MGPPSHSQSHHPNPPPLQGDLCHLEIVPVSRRHDSQRCQRQNDVMAESGSSADGRNQVLDWHNPQQQTGRKWRKWRKWQNGRMAEIASAIKWQTYPNAKTEHSKKATPPPPPSLTHFAHSKNPFLHSSIQNPNPKIQTITETPTPTCSLCLLSSFLCASAT